MQQVARKRIGAGRRRMPGDVVTGTHQGAEFIGRIASADNLGRVAVQFDGGALVTFAPGAAATLRTIQEVDDAPIARVRLYGTAIVVHVLDARTREVA